MKQGKNIGNPIFSFVLKREMDLRNLTQDAVARAADASQATVNGWLTGALPRADALQRLARAWNCSMEYLLTGEYDTASSGGFVVAESNDSDLDHLLIKIENARTALDDIERALKKNRR